MKKEFYNYIYLDPRKPGNYQYDEYMFDHEPFYIGKGKGDRIIRHLNTANFHNKTKNPHKNRIIKKIIKEDLIPIFLILQENLSEKKAFEKEIDLISKIGRYNLGNGPLTNLTDGGDGQTGWKHSEKTKEKLRNTSIKIWKNKEYRKNQTEKAKKNWDNNPQWRKEMSERFKGENNHSWGGISKEIKEKISKTRKRLIKRGVIKPPSIKKWIVVNPQGIKEEIEGLSNYCKLNNLCVTTLSNWKNKGIIPISRKKINCSEKRINSSGWQLITV